MRRLILILTVFALAASGQELVRNGDFENGFTHWEQDLINNQGSYEITRSTGYRPGPDYSARVYKYMRYYARLQQIVELPSTDVRFSVDAKLLASKGPTSGYYANAAIILEYMNAGHSIIGHTAILKSVGNFNPGSFPNQRYQYITSNDWETYEFDLNDELARLTGINPAHVTAIRLAIEAYGTGATG